MHVTEGTHDKAQLREMLYADREMRRVMLAVAEALDYPDVFSRYPLNHTVSVA